MTEIDLTPVTRLEYDIDAILNDHAVAEPITRIELILADIVAGNTTTVEPVTRIETYLAIISGADYPVPEPVTRIETFLAIIAGEDYETPEAVTRLEGLLAEWVEKGSGIWKTVTGTLIHITDALASPVKELSVAIEPQQSGSGDPSPTNVRPITGWTGANIYVSGADTSSPTTYPISWQTEAGTVYGGTLDVVNGELTSTKGKIVLNGNETWSAVGGAFYTEALPEGYALDSQDDWICNKYKPATKIPRSTQIADRDNLTVFNQNNYERRVFIKDTSITSVADLQASLASNPVEIVFTLPTSSEHTVTPVSVSTLAGENNIWADVNGEITIEYLAKG